MKCTHCGGNIGIEDKVCPFCGQPSLHALQHQKDMARYEEAFEKTRQNVESRTSRFSGLAVPFTLAGIMLVLVVASFIFAVSSYDIGRSMVSRKMARDEAAYADRIDALIADGDYLQLDAFYNNRSLYILTGTEGSRLQSYELIFRAADYNNSIFETLMLRLEPDNYRFTPERISETCGYLADDISRLYSLEKETYFSEGCYEADKLAVLGDIRKQTSAMLQTYAGFSADETAQIPDMSKAKLQVMLEEKLGALVKEDQG